MDWSKSTVFWGAILSAMGLWTWTDPARAKCTSDGAIAEVVGQIPDLIFLTGQSSTIQSLDVQYTGIAATVRVGETPDNCGIQIHSNIPGVGLGTNYRMTSTGVVEHMPLQFGDVGVGSDSNEAGGAVGVGFLGRLVNTFDVGVTEASLANVPKVPKHGVIEIYSWTNGFCQANWKDWPTWVSSCGGQRIGAINVYIMDANKQFPLTFPVTATLSNTGTFPVTAAFNNTGCSFGITVPSDITIDISRDCPRNSLWFDNPFTNGNPSARLLVTQNWNPNGGAARYNPHNIGVSYDGTRWRIFNQDGAAMSLGASFNVRIEGNAPPVVGPATNSSSRVYIDDWAANLNPNAIILATPNFNSRPGRFGRTGGVYNNHPIGVDYDSQTGRWFIFNEDFAPMSAQAAFNVKVYGIQDTVLQGNIGDTDGPVGPVGVNTGVALVQDPQRSVAPDSMIIDRWFTNGNPSASVFITHNANEVFHHQSRLNAHPAGVWYYNEQNYNHWFVFNEDQATLGADAAFNTIVPLAPRFGGSFGPVGQICCIILP